MSIFPADEFGNLLTSKLKSPALKGSSERLFPLCVAVPSEYLLNSFIFSFNSFISLDVRGLALVILGVSVGLASEVFTDSYWIGLGSGFQNSLAFYHNPLEDCSGIAFSQAFLCHPPPNKYPNLLFPLDIYPKGLYHLVPTGAYLGALGSLTGFDVTILFLPIFELFTIEAPSVSIFLVGLSLLYFSIDSLTLGIFSISESTVAFFFPSVLTC